MASYICNYCGHYFKWTGYYNQSPKCTKCGDSDVKLQKEVKKVDFYPEQGDNKPDGFLYPNTEDWGAD